MYQNEGCMKKCIGCLVEKELQEFYLNKTGYYNPYCKPCNKIRTRDYRRKNTHAHYLRKVKGKFKISKEDYLILHDKHNGNCAICFKNNDGRRLSIDHCHETGKIRGLLCRKCNLALGYFSDNVEYLKKAILYLQE